MSNLRRQLSISDHWQQKGVDAILDEWGGEDKKNGFSNEVCRAIYWQYRRDEQEAEFRKGYPEEFISDSELEFKISQFPPSWSILPRVDIGRAIYYAVTVIQIEQDLNDPVKTAYWKARRRRFELKETLKTLEAKESVLHKDKIASIKKELDEISRKEADIPPLEVEVFNPAESSAMSSQQGEALESSELSFVE